jgi:hypothetical protein
MDIERYAGTLPVSRDMRRAQRAANGLVSSTRLQQAGMRAVSSVAEYGMSEVMYLTKIKNDLAMTCPDASEALALISSTANMAIARSVARFSSEVTG